MWVRPGDPKAQLQEEKRTEERLYSYTSFSSIVPTQTGQGTAGVISMYELAETMYMSKIRARRSGISPFSMKFDLVMSIFAEVFTERKFLARFCAADKSLIWISACNCLQSREFGQCWSY